MTDDVNPVELGRKISELLGGFDYNAAIKKVDGFARKLTIPAPGSHHTNEINLAQQIKQVTDALPSGFEGRIGLDLGKQLLLAEKESLQPARQAFFSIKQTFKEAKIYDHKGIPRTLALTRKIERLSDTYLYAIKEIMDFNTAQKLAITVASNKIDEVLADKNNGLSEYQEEEYRALKDHLLPPFKTRMDVLLKDLAGDIALHHSALQTYMTKLAAAPGKAANGV